MSAEVAEIGDLAGGLGRYQLMIVTMIFLRSFPSSWTLTGLEFVAGDVDHWCAPRNRTYTQEVWKRDFIPPKEHCHQFALNGSVIDRSVLLKCDSWTFNTTLLSSSVEEFNLVCDSSWQKSAIQSNVFVAQIAGALVTGRISDRYGRLPVYMWSTTLFVVFGVAAAFSPSVIIFNILRFVQCVCIAGLNTCISTFYAEVSLPKHRSLLNVGFALGFQIPMLFLPSLAGYLHNWRHVQMAMALSAVPLLPFFFFLQESPRWLLMRGNFEKAHNTLEKILKFNRMDSTILERMPRTAKQTSKHESSALQLFSPALLPISLALFALWFMCQLSFYASIFTSTRLPGNKSLNFALTAAAGVGGGALSIVLLRWVKRRRTLGLFLTLSSVSFIILAALPRDSAIWIHVGTAMLLRFTMVISAGVCWTYSLEVFPTMLRNFGFSCCFCFGRIGGAIAPFMRDLGEWHTSAPFLVLSLACLVGCLSLPLLPETLNAALPDNLEESVQLRRSTKSENLPTANDFGNLKQ